MRNKMKALILSCLGMLLLSGQALAEDGLFEKANTSDVQVLKAHSKEQTARHLISKNFSLTRYEMLILSEAIRKDIETSNISNEEKESALKDIMGLQKKYQDDYKKIFNKDVDSNEIKSSEATPAKESSSNQEVSSNQEGASVSQTAPLMSQDSISALAESIGIDYSPSDNARIENPKATRERIKASSSPQELADNMSLINIRKAPMTKEEVEASKYVYTSPMNPITDLNKEQTDLQPITADMLPEEEPSFDAKQMKDLVEAAVAAEEKKAKNFYLTVAHSIYYVDQNGTGNIPLDTTKVDDNGNYYEPAVTKQHQVHQVLEIGIGARVNQALDLVMTIIGENEDGLLNGNGTSWDFGNVFFKFHPERMDKIAIQKMNSEGVIIRNGGKVVGKRIGHGTAFLTDTETGSSALQIGNSKLAYDKDDGFTFSTADSRYYVGFGRLSLNFSSYTLQLSNCKAVEVGYHDNAESLVLLYGKPQSLKEGTSNGTEISEGTYDKKVFGAQYKTNKLIKGLNLAFNFATAKSGGSLEHPNGAIKTDSTVYSLVVKSKENENTSFEGEFAHSVNTYNTDSKNPSRVSGNADYFDLTHRFSSKLGATLHLINIDGSFDASSLVEDKTGDNLLTTNQGDGIPDYLYESGQRGLDLVLDYKISDTAALALGYTRYSLTTKGNSKTNFYLSGSKQWSLSDQYGKRQGVIGLQQRFEYNKVSNKDYTKKTSDTTLSYAGEPWEDGEVAADFQRIIDNADGNETRYDITVAHHFYPMKRVVITPKIEYERKQGSPGIEDKDTMDSSKLIESLTIGYELIPDELTVNFLVSKENYNVISSEIDESTGKRIDGERRKVLGMGLGLVWEPKKIKGLTLGVSYRKDRVDYLDRQDTSNQDVWEYTAEYSRPLSDKVRASISYDYKSARDKAKPIYDEVTRTVSIDIDAEIGKHSSLQLQHNYEMEYKPSDYAANHTTHTTVFQMVNRW